LEIRELAAFDKTIEDLDPQEQQRRRKAYLRQAMMEIDQGKKMFNSMGCAMLPFLVIPIFWPFLIFQRRTANRMQQMMEGYVTSACEYWGITLQEDSYHSGQM
jgi:hypothetical protein